MINRLHIVVVLLVLLFSCKTKQEERRQTSSPRVQAIAILPFSGMDPSIVAEVQKGLQQHLSVHFTLLKEAALPEFAFYKPRNRYIADSLLVFLRKHKDKKYDKIIGITARDISTKKNQYPNYGIMGQGYCPGEACVISAFRPKRNADRKLFIQRMIILGLHELGHTYALSHCPDQSCFMVDAEGKMKLDIGQSYCTKCRSVLLKKGVLRSGQK